MVSERLLVAVALLGFTPTLFAEEGAATPGPIESRPYRIRAIVAFEPEARVDDRSLARLVDAWRGLARRMVGPAWDLRPDTPGPGVIVPDLDRLVPAEAQSLGVGVDKVWMIRGRRVGGALHLSGREFDVATGWLGSLHERHVPVLADLPRELFRLSAGMFAPYAEIGEPKGDLVPIRVQGSALPRGGGTGDLIAGPGTVFRPVRVFYREDGSVLDVQKIPFSYLKVTARDGPTTTCVLVRGVRDPLSKRVVRKNALIALGVKPAASPTRLRFVGLPDRAPAAGYSLTARAVGPGALPREVATTDREGRVSLPPGWSSDLVILRLIAGKAEPMVEFPLMPGESPDELTIPFDPKPRTIALETQLDALRDSIVDLVAVRSRLERRMKARESGDDWAGVAEALGEFRKLPPRETFAKRLERLQEEARRQEAQTKSVVLTKTALAQLSDTKGLIDRYLDDDPFLAYEEAVARSKSRDARPKTPKAVPSPAARTAELTPVETPDAPASPPTSKKAGPAPFPSGSVPF